MTTLDLNQAGDYFGKLDPQSLVAGADPLQTQAAGGAAGLTGAGFLDSIRNAGAREGNSGFYHQPDFCCLGPLPSRLIAARRG